MAVQIPPWLNVQPSDFVQAASAGARIGAQLASIAEREQAAAERGQAAAAVASARSGAQSEIAHARMAQAAQEAEASRRLREWEQNQRLGMEQERLTSQEQRAAETLGQRGQYQEALLGLRERGIQTAEERLKAQEERANAAMAMKMSPVDAGFFNDALIRRRQAQTEASKSLESLSAGGKVPPDINARIAAAQQDIDALSKKYMQPFQSGAQSGAAEGAAAPAGTPAGMQEGQIVRSKSTGRMGTVVGGQIQWDPESTPPASERVYGGLPGEQDVTQGEMYLGRRPEDYLTPAM